ncbi:hypothetical protein H7K45_28665 [Mycobacterium yunnanensis]|uniref:Uncharacterized protein n=1 Tax=Mycobacterium yunnanensis TaxID=368477 RepID=A0A9X3C3K1_9MYCO|nr:hypothetical protein [Mycobacterium yunnanensis]MCV7424523.1 hypothetical protein [Mycobacterium yunnanensis]
MSDGIVGIIKDAVVAAVGITPSAVSAIPDSVADPEAVHAVQKHYAEAGFVLDENTAQDIVDHDRI